MDTDLEVGISKRGGKGRTEGDGTYLKKHVVLGMIYHDYLQFQGG
jgi:hypothetical protein